MCNTFQIYEYIGIAPLLFHTFCLSSVWYVEWTTTLRLVVLTFGPAKSRSFSY